MGKDTFDTGDLIGIGHFLDDWGDFVVAVTGFDQSESGLGGFIGSQDDIGLFAGDGSVFVGLDYDGVADKGSESVDMDTEFDFDEISFFDDGGVFWVGGVVCAYFVGADGGGEGQSFEYWFFVIDLRQFFIDLSVCPEA